MSGVMSSNSRRSYYSYSYSHVSDTPTLTSVSRLFQQPLLTHPIPHVCNETYDATR